MKSFSQFMIVIATGAATIALSPTAEARTSRSELRPGRCNQAAEILSAAVGDLLFPTDSLSRLPPTFPTVPVESADRSSLRLVRLTADSGFWRVDWRGDPPSADLIRRWYAAPYLSISKCFSESPAEPKLNRVPGFISTRTGHEPERDRMMVRATAPVFDRSGRYALVLYETYLVHPGLGGRVGLALLERSGSGWRRAGSRVLAES